ncbi:MAG TPA: fibrinogen-like YCDxxxxGGGW domain-containing protein [Oligoflexus sp.]|uniref:fibrinogen-like YCDxxxxGGGW domain-containing protein n=1 Tax=Oligoflexus sp. TaxID=1971216 RepID=UPI002D80FC0C|nr:fibrinogen-like YCDxxxxGGGW domain-containing protein [Oligoflexus sp.]HET9240882.1 fibrinogen-like YCDxxxxGGGW domain-containing protein [Oligoflexus sp.]
MKRLLLSTFILVPLPACQDRKQPHVPDEKALAPVHEAEAEAALPAYEAPEAPAQEIFYPRDCLALKKADPALPSAIYSIYPLGADADKAVAASCDMDTDGGGWTLILNYNHRAATNPELVVRLDSLPLLGSDSLGRDESLEPEFWGHAGNELLRSLTGFRELRFQCRSSENTRIMHFKTADADCISAVQLGRGSCANIGNAFVPMSDHTALLPAAMDRAEVDRLDVTLTYNTFGKTEVDTPARMWSVRAEPSQQAWECDYGTNDFMFDTLHRVWIR